MRFRKFVNKFLSHDDSYDPKTLTWQKLHWVYVDAKASNILTDENLESLDFVRTFLAFFVQNKFRNPKTRKAIEGITEVIEKWENENIVDLDLLESTRDLIENGVK